MGERALYEEALPPRAERCILSPGAGSLEQHKSGESMNTRNVFLGTAALATAALVVACAGMGEGAGSGGNISGTVTSGNGPEAGVWVIAETTDLPTKYAKLVVTDDQGRYLIPDLPKANYRVWVRGYVLVDS